MMTCYDDDYKTPEQEWAGWNYETDRGTFRYSAVHLIDAQGNPACGAAPKRGVEWLAECDSAGRRCSRCQKIADRSK